MAAHKTPLSSERSANSQALGIVLASVAFGAVGQLVLKAGMNSVGRSQFSADTLVRMATNPLVLVGGAIFAISTLLWLLALSRADLSFAYPFLSLIYLAVLVGGPLFFNETLTVGRVAGFACIIFGVWVVARSERRP